MYEIAVLWISDDHQRWWFKHLDVQHVYMQVEWLYQQSHLWLALVLKASTPRKWPLGNLLMRIQSDCQVLAVLPKITTWIIILNLLVFVQPYLSNKDVIASLHYPYVLNKFGRFCVAICNFGPACFTYCHPFAVYNSAVFETKCNNPQ